MEQNKISKKAQELKAIGEAANMAVLVVGSTVTVYAHNFEVARTGRHWNLAFVCKGKKKGWDVSVHVEAVTEGTVTATYNIEPSEDFDAQLAHRFRRMNLPKAMKAEMTELAKTIQSLKN